MEDLTAVLERLSCEDAFRLLYGAYDYLGQLPADVHSATRSLLERLEDDEPEAILQCVQKMLEEQEEVRLVLAGRHAHPGQSPRQTLVNELQQTLYWPLLIAVARAVPYETLRLPDFLRAGLEDRGPSKKETAGAAQAEAVILRRAAVAAGRAIAEFNRQHPDQAIDPREPALADLRQMATKEYMLPHLRARLGIAHGPA
jgi:hypothetical protein